MDDEIALRRVLDVVQRYLPPNGMTAKEALSKIISIIDPWPLDMNTESAPLNWPTLDPMAPIGGKAPEYEPVLYRNGAIPITRVEFFAELAAGLADAAPTPSDRQGFEPREYTERS